MQWTPGQSWAAGPDPQRPPGTQLPRGSGRPGSCASVPPSRTLDRYRGQTQEPILQVQVEFTISDPRQDRVIPFGEQAVPFTSSQ